jgi:predicted lipoprotein with Yx(FWY)xxD motif
MRRSLALAALALAAAGGFSTSVLASAQRATVSLRSTPLGRVLAGSNGHVLYRFMADKTKASTCSGACASNWPPLVATGPPVAGAGVKQALLGTTKRRDGKLQVTYAGRPLYFFVGDAKAGETKGQAVSAFGARWYVVSAAGAIVKSSASGGTSAAPGYTSPTDTTGGGGYYP